jgi:hypothetical protein
MSEQLKLHVDRKSILKIQTDIVKVTENILWCMKEMCLERIVDKLKCINM